MAITAMLTMTVSHVDRQTLSALAPTVTKALDLSDTQYGLLGSAFAFAYLFATPIGGWWIGRMGARRGLVGSLLAWSAVAALHSLVPNLAGLFALRIALGLAEGPGFPGAAQTVQRVLGPADRARGFGVLFMGSSIGAAIAPKLASWLADEIGWRGAFLGTAFVGFAWLVPWIVLTSRPHVRAALDTPREHAPRTGWPEIVRLLREPAMIRALVAIFAAAPGIALTLTWGAKYLATTFAIKQGQVGDYLWLPPLVFDLAGALLFGDLAARMRRADGTPPRFLVAVALVLAAAMVALPFATTPWQSIAILSVTMAGGGALYTLVTADLMSRVDHDQIALAGGVMAGAQSLAAIIGNPLIGWAVDRTGSYDTVAFALAAWVVPGTVAWLVANPMASATRSAPGSRSTP